MKRLLCVMVALCLCLCGCGPSYRTTATVGNGGVLIDPGHGGMDGGAVAADGTLEKHINLAIALCLRDLLTVTGIPVTMTRDADVALCEESSTIHSKKVSDMRKRLTMYNTSAAVISIHQNHFSESKYHGTQIFYSPNRDESRALANSVRSAVLTMLQPDNQRELKQATNGIYLLHHAESPAILVECGFLSNPQERDRLKNLEYQQQMAFAVTAGYWNYQVEE